MSDFRDNFSPAERELWLAQGGKLPWDIKPFVADWAPVAAMADIIRNDNKAQSLGGDPNRRHYPELERYVAARMARKKRRAA